MASFDDKESHQRHTPDFLTLIYQHTHTHMYKHDCIDIHTHTHTRIDHKLNRIGTTDTHTR